MNICYKILNSLKTIQRIRYFCMKPNSLLETNCGYSDPKDTPRSIITWNVQGLFYFMNPYKQHKIIETINDFTADVVCLQEVFEDSLKQLNEKFKEIERISGYNLAKGEKTSIGIYKRIN